MQSAERLAVQINGCVLQARNDIHYHKLLALQHFVHALIRDAAPGDIAKIVLFGSVARGDAEWDSDVDVLVLTARPAARLSEAIERVAATVPVDAGDGILSNIAPVVAPVSYWFVPNAHFIQSVIENGLEVFTMPDNQLQRALASNLYFLAVDYLQGAKDNRASGNFRIAVDADYNAIELAMKSFRVGQAKDIPTRHGAVNRLFGQIYIAERQQFSPVFGSRLNPALELRNRARYMYEAQITDADAGNMLDIADTLLARLRDHVLTFGQQPDEEEDDPRPGP